jgi:hypothetical protein
VPLLAFCRHWLTVVISWIAERAKMPEIILSFGLLIPEIFRMGSSSEIDTVVETPVR